LRYPSDLTDDEWGLVEPLIPPGKTGGGKRTVIMREVVNGLMYILSTGCQWRAIPKDLPLRRDNQDENPATIRMRMRRCWGDEGRA
jgi:transposase